MTENKMKICFLGGDIFTKKWVDYFSKKYDVFWLTFHDNMYSKDTPDNVAVYLFKKISGGNIVTRYASFAKVAVEFKKTIHRIKPDILCAFYLSHYGFIGAFSNFHPFVAIPLGGDIAVDPYLSIIKQKLTRYTLKKADLIITHDPLSKKQMICISNDLNEEKIKVIPWGVDIDKFVPSSYKKIYDIIIINIRGDNINVFLDALSLVKKEIKDIRAIWIGYQPTEEIIRRTSDLKLSKNLEFTGLIKHDDVVKYLHKSKIFIDTFFPSHNRGGHSYGIALLEAMACGIPTIVARRPTVVQLKGEDKWYFGDIFDGTNSRDLAKKILDLMNDEERRIEIAKKNRNIIEEKFNWKKNVHKIEKELHNLLVKK